MQVNNVAPITLIYPTNKTFTIDVYGYCGWDIAALYSIGDDHSTRPTAFRWPDSHLRPITPKLITWLQTDFKAMFDYQPFMWMASVATVDPKLQPYLKDLFNDQA